MFASVPNSVFYIIYYLKYNRASVPKSFIKTLTNISYLYALNLYSSSILITAESSDKRFKMSMSLDKKFKKTTDPANFPVKNIKVINDQQK